MSRPKQRRRWLGGSGATFRRDLPRAGSIPFISLPRAQFYSPPGPRTSTFSSEPAQRGHLERAANRSSAKNPRARHHGSGGFPVDADGHAGPDYKGRRFGCPHPGGGSGVSDVAFFRSGVTGGRGLEKNGLDTPEVLWKTWRGNAMMLHVGKSKPRFDEEEQERIEQVGRSRAPE